MNQWIDLKSALAESCDTYFYQVGFSFYNLPPGRGHPLQNWASRFGFGATTGVDVQGEVSGLVPTPEWRREHFPGPPYYRRSTASGSPGLGPAGDRPGRSAGDAAPDDALLRDARERRPARDAAHRRRRRAADERPERRRASCSASARSRRPRAASTRARSGSSATASTRRRTRRSARRMGSSACSRFRSRARPEPPRS